MRDEQSIDITPAPFDEDSYGRLKRFRFVAASMTANVGSILDVGCGTGAQLTKPLAEAFPKVRTLGIDSDLASLTAARTSGGPPLLEYATTNELFERSRFDLVIASEVLEHVEDPEAFLVWLRSRLNPNGRIVLTTPNGYGPAEVIQFLENILTLSGIWPVIRSIKRRIRAQPPHDETLSAGGDSLAVSPHINFFTLRKLRALFGACGLEVRRFRPRTFLCGFLIDQLIATFRVADWNARISDRLPNSWASGWMFELVARQPSGSSSWKRTRLDMIRRRLNERRWGISS